MQQGRAWPCDWMEQYWSLQIFQSGTRSAFVLQLFTTFHHFFTAGCEGPGDAVPLEFLFAGAPKDTDEQRLGDALREAVEERLQAERRAEFRSQLKQRQDSSLRRRKASAAEEGDAAEEGLMGVGEKWRSYLQKPAQEVKLKVHAVFDAGTRMRKVLGCRVSLSPEAAQDLGKICFRHVFETEDEERERLQQLKWYEDCQNGLHRF
eukprot:symbB.v1.2.038110.t1/scaffold5828.1/size23302/5